MRLEEVARWSASGDAEDWPPAGSALVAARIRPVDAEGQAVAGPALWWVPWSASSIIGSSASKAPILA